MQTLNDALIDLVKSDTVEAQEAYDRAPNKKEFGILLTRAGFKGPWSEEKPRPLSRTKSRAPRRRGSAR